VTEVIKLVSLRTPLPKVEFPNGRVLQVHDATALTERLIREMNADLGNTEKTMAVLRNLVPEATDADWELLTAEDSAHILDIAMRKIAVALEIVEARRKNGDAGGAAGPTKRSRRSSRTTTSRTSAPASPTTTTSATSP